jgi:VanZ family protein
MKYLIWAPIVAVLFGAFLESIQRTISATRSSSLYDFLANAAGIFASVLFFYFFVSERKWEKLF